MKIETQFGAVELRRCSKCERLYFDWAVPVQSIRVYAIVGIAESRCQGCQNQNLRTLRSGY